MTDTLSPAERSARMRLYQKPDDDTLRLVRLGAHSELGRSMNSTALPPARRPLSGRVQDTQHAHQVAGDVIDQDVILVRDQLPGACDTARPPDAGVIDHPAGLLRK